MLRPILLLSLLLATPHPAVACSVPPTSDLNPAALEQDEREAIVKTAEVIVEGVIEPTESDDLGITLARMHIDRVWKGAVAPDVVVIMGLRLKICPTAPLRLGEKMRFSARLLEKRFMLVKDAIELTPEQAQLIETHDDFLFIDAPSRTMPIGRLPLQDPELDRLLVQYHLDTEAMRLAAESGDRAARLAYAAHLFDNNELNRALIEYEGILAGNPSDLDLQLTLAVVRAQVQPDDEPEATLAEVERKAPRTPEWQRKIAHARFVATGRLTPGWKDWSDLKPAKQCEVSEGNFDDANFDRAQLATCEFVRSSFRNASFLGADLTDAYFEDSSLAGAKYDCATRLPDDLDPKAAGMIDAEGSCPSP
ncbi:hypothetical protein DLREEDagr8_11240 [Dongia sp. agr-C8]